MSIQNKIPAEFSWNDLPEAMRPVGAQYSVMARYLVDVVPPGPVLDHALRYLLKSREEALFAIAIEKDL